MLRGCLGEHLVELDHLFVFVVEEVDLEAGDPNPVAQFEILLQDLGRLEAGLGPSDRRKLDEYLSSIREVERQLERSENENTQIDPHMDKPYGVPADFAEHFKLMSSMIAIAFQADLTRVVTFLVTREGSLRPYRELDIA